MIAKLLAGTILVAMATLAVAQTDPIATRRNIMKTNGAATRTGGQMAKGEIPFDLAKAQEVFQNYVSAAAVFPTLFPDSSKTGGDTTASPKIWEDMADFKGRFETWSKDVKQAQADTKDLETFRTAFGNVTKACGSCHSVYRIKT